MKFSISQSSTILFSILNMFCPLFTLLHMNIRDKKIYFFILFNLMIFALEIRAATILKHGIFVTE